MWPTDRPTIWHFLFNRAISMWFLHRFRRNSARLRRRTTCRRWPGLVTIRLFLPRSRARNPFQTHLGFLGKGCTCGHETRCARLGTPQDFEGANNVHPSRETSKIGRYLFLETQNPFFKSGAISTKLTTFVPDVTWIPEQVAQWGSLSRETTQAR